MAREIERSNMEQVNFKKTFLPTKSSSKLDKIMHPKIKFSYLFSIYLLLANTLENHGHVDGIYAFTSIDFSCRTLYKLYYRIEPMPHWAYRRNSKQYNLAVRLPSPRSILNSYLNSIEIF